MWVRDVAHGGRPSTSTRRGSPWARALQSSPAMIIDASGQRRVNELAALQRMIASREPRAVLAVLQGTLEQLSMHVGRPPAVDIESRIVDAAVLFDAVADVRSLVWVLDKDLRDIASRLARFLDDVENGIAADLRVPAA